MNARARIHAMFNLNETAETELNHRLDALTAEELHQAADEIDQASQRLVVKKTVVNILRRRANTVGEEATADAATATPADAEVLPKADVVAWLVKKAREFRAAGGRERAAQADAIAAMASKIERGAIRSNNLRMLPANGDFFEPGRTYTREHHGRRIEFHVRYVDTAPDCDFPTAFGWRKDPEMPCLLPMDSDDLTGWTDTTNDTTTGDNT